MNPKEKQFPVNCGAVKSLLRSISILPWRVLPILLACGLLPSVRAAETLMVTNATWRFFDTGADLGTAWRATNFNDSLWNAGPAQFGFGDGDESTIINGGPSNARYITTYFRTTVVITNRSSLTNFAARLLRDDGAVVYVNGAEAFRQNMPGGVIVASTTAAAGALEESTFYPQAIPPALFIQGTNLIAVEVHQVNATSSDLSFAMELLANTPLGNIPPAVTLVQPAAGATFLAGAPIVVQAAATDPSGPVQLIEILLDNAVIASGVGSAITITNSISAVGTHIFFIRATGGQGTGYSITNRIGIHPPDQHMVLFPNFTTETNLIFQNDAFVRDGRLHLSMNPPVSSSGGAFIPVKQFVRDGFDMTFQYEIFDLVNRGGDGLAFVIQNNPLLRSGNNGGSIGYAGISNSLAVEFDTLDNSQLSDPDDNHISVHTRGTLPNNEHQSYALGTASGVGLNGVHTVRILYTPGLLKVFFDNLTNPVLSVSVNLATLFPLDFGRAWIGLTAATGVDVEAHDILWWSVLTPEPISLRVTNPAPAAILTAPVLLLVGATATANIGSVTHVEFYDDGVLFGDKAGAGPYQAQWETTRLGPHTIVAVAYNSLGSNISSEPFTVFVQAGDGRTTLSPPGSVWHYLDRGVDQGTVWRAAGFDNSTWRLGAAQLGYGEDDEVTAVYGGPSANRFPTTYFRRNFTVTNLASLTNLAVRLLRDDGAVVHLNGSEMLRSNMPAGPISYGTLASTAVGGSDETNFFVSPVNLGLLVEGVNTLAVEIHQVDIASSDVSFDLELVANTPLGNRAPYLVFTGVTNGQRLLTGQTLALQATAADPGGIITRVDLVGDSLLLTNSTNATLSLAWSNLLEGAHTIFARAVNDQGVTNRSAIVTFTVVSVPQLLNAARLPDGSFRMTVPTGIGLNYQVQYSENLVTWFNAGPPLAGTGQPLVWIDAGQPLTPALPANTAHRFYKVVMTLAP